MKIELSCPHAKYEGSMQIHCTKADLPCGHVYFKRCKGWWALTPSADRCLLRREEKRNE